MKDTDKVTLTVGQLKKLVKESEEKMYHITYHKHFLDGTTTHGDVYLKANGMMDAKEKFIQMCINMGCGKTREQIIRDIEFYVYLDMPTNW